MKPRPPNGSPGAPTRLYDARYQSPLGFMFLPRQVADFIRGATPINDAHAFEPPGPRPPPWPTP